MNGQHFTGGEMSIHLKKLLPAIIMLLLLPLHLWAQDEKTALLDELYIKSGMEKQNADIPAALKEGFDQGLKSDTNANKVSPAVIHLIRNSIDSSFSSEQVKTEILQSFKKSLSETQIRSILKWLDSPVGKKCTELEEAGSDPNNFEKRMDFEKKLKENPVSEARLELIRKLNQATKGTEATVSVAVGMQMALMTAVNLSMPEEERMPYQKMKKEIDTQKPRIRAMIEPRVIIGFIYTYRTLTDPELEEYIKFLSTDVGLKYSAASIEGLKKALEDGSMKWGRAIAEILSNAEKHSDT
jgi:hypothetical protein